MNTFRIVEDSARRAACLTAIVHDGTLIDATVTWFVKSPESPVVLIHGGTLGGTVVYSDLTMDADPIGDDDDIDYRVLQALVAQAVRRYLREHRSQASAPGPSVWERLRERWLTGAPTAQGMNNSPTPLALAQREAPEKTDEHRRVFGSEAAPVKPPPGFRPVGSPPWGEP